MRPASVLTALGAALVSGVVSISPSPPTFAREVAPLVHAKCGPCHHEGGVGPFPLLTRDDLVEHASEIERVTASRFMPPWRPSPGWVDYANDRSLTPAEIDLLARFINAGELAGDGPPPAPP